MADETLKIDANNKPVIGLVTDDANLSIRMGRIDNTTKGLKVMLVGGTGAGTVTSVATTGSVTGGTITTSGTINLVNDNATPGNSFYYGTNSSGTKGFFSLPTGGSGTVTTVSVVTANGFAGTVANATSTPAITLTTSITGILQGNGTAISAATTTGSGNVVLATSPTLTTSALLSSGFAFNFASSNVVLTHSSGVLTLSPGDLQITTAGTNTASVVTVGGTQRLTNKFVTPRTNTTTTSATPAINTDTTDDFTITALATAITSFTTSLTGTPVNGQSLIIRILDNGTARAITWGASFISRGATLPTTTVISKYLYVGFLWNSTTSTWDCVAVSQEA